MDKVLIFLTDGFEEIEALTVVDLLRRAEIDIRMVSVTGKEYVTGSHEIEVRADELYDDLAWSWEEVDMLVLPGGPGTGRLGEHQGLVGRLKEFHQKQAMLAAICAAPSILGINGMLEGKNATCYPGFEDKLLGAKWLEQSVVKDGNVITSRGLGTAIDFASAIIAHFKGEEKARQIEKSVIYS